MLYRTIYVWVKSAIWLYFSKIEVHGLSNIPNNQPILLAVNHQNALLDALVVAVSLKRPVHFMTRADIFKKKTIGKILRALNLIPIYRLRDGLEELEKNEQIFDECNQLLAENKIILIFPEGSHLYQRRLRPLKKGVARIAVGGVLAIKKDVFIVPVGINYESHKHSCSWLNLSFGKPISTLELLEENGLNSSQTTHQLTEIISEKLKECIVNIEDKENYDFINLFSKINFQKSNENRNFIAQQQWVKKYNELENSVKEEVISKTKEYQKLWNKLALPPRQMGKINNSISIFQILITPSYLLAYLLFLPAKLCYHKLISNFADRQWEASIKVVSIMIFYPIWILCLLLAMFFLIPNYFLWAALALFAFAIVFKFSKNSAEKALFYLRIKAIRKKSEIYLLKKLELELQKIKIL